MLLNQANLSKINGTLKVPTYDRAQLTSGIVHIGVGGFHRAHQGFVIQKLIEKGGHNNWGICGIGLREEDRKVAEVFDRQDCLYTLITRHPDGQIATEVMAQMNEFLWAPRNKQAVIDRLAHSETNIVSLTITEGGYHLRPDGDLELDHPDIQHELHDPNDPRTIYGYLTEALRQRRKRGQDPFTIMSCDNIQHNGDVIRKMLLSFISAGDHELAAWVEREGTFPNSMVDRITPVTTTKEIDYLRGNFEFEDEWPVTCEPFLQWVIEDKFSGDRPDFDKVKGVQFVADVTPYEKMKIRLLNAGHSVLGIFGALKGIQTIDACVENELLRKVLRKFWDEEASPILGKVEGIDLQEYKESLLTRFGNPNIKDQVSRICSESSAKLPKFLLPTISENLKKGGEIEVATWVIAAWCYYSDQQVDKTGNALKVTDQMSDQLQEAALRTSVDRAAFLSVSEVFGDLKENEVFNDMYVERVSLLYEQPDMTEQLKRICI